MKAIWAIIGMIVAGILGACFFFTNQIMYMRKKTEDEILKREAGTHFDLTEFEALPKEEVWIASQFGYNIHGYYIPAANSKKFMVFCHGVTVNKLNSIKYSNLFLKRNFNVFIYDHRRHGQSGGKTTSFGYYEKHDLQTIVHWLKERFGSDIVLGIHGESMGAATLLQYAGHLEDGADFYIADCPFSDFYEQLTYRLKEEFKLPAWPLLPLANAVLKLRDGYTVQDVSPIQCIKHIKNPVLFIHSKDDDYILSKMTEEMYEQKEGPKELFIAEKGRHALSYAENKEMYEKVIDHFLETYVQNRLS
ncbi:alpha/beta hydrolase [Microbacteriaceae bacterium 4G12]